MLNLAGESGPSLGSALLVLLCSSWANSMKCLPGELAQPLPYQNHLPGPNWKKQHQGLPFQNRLWQQTTGHGLSAVGFGWINPRLQTLVRWDNMGMMGAQGGLSPGKLIPCQVLCAARYKGTR